MKIIRLIPIFCFGLALFGCDSNVPEIEHYTLYRDLSHSNKHELNIAYIEVNCHDFMQAAKYTRADGSPFFDIIILFAANIVFNPDKGPNGTVSVELNSHIRSALQRQSEIRSIREKGVLVLLSILGGHEHIGLANLNWADTDSLATEIERIVNYTNIDGVDFDDEYADYRDGYHGRYLNPASFPELLAKLEAKFTDRVKEYGFNNFYGNYQTRELVRHDKMMTYFHLTNSEVEKQRQIIENNPNSPTLRNNLSYTDRTQNHNAFLRTLDLNNIGKYFAYAFNGEYFPQNIHMSNPTPIPGMNHGYYGNESFNFSPDVLNKVREQHPTFLIDSYYGGARMNRVRLHYNIEGIWNSEPERTFMIEISEELYRGGLKFDAYPLKY